jgi:hypothetical protein
MVVAHLGAASALSPEQIINRLNAVSSSFPVSLYRQSHLRRSSQDESMADFAIRMKNQLQFSTCETPHRPITPKHEEVLDVALRGDLLIIAEVRKNNATGKRIYAQRTIELPGVSTFVILPELPSHARDGSFFPALGTVAVFIAKGGTGRRLRAVGMDVNSGHCHGWIFDAVEV